MDYKPNSRKSKLEAANLPAEKKVEKVVTGKVITKKKNGISKVAESLISEDIHNVKNYVVMDVLIPAMKKAISDIITNGIDMILYGETRGRDRRTNSSYVSYNKYSDRDRRDDRYRGSSTRSGYSHRDVIVETRAEAEEVLERMDELIDTYDQVTVADMFDLVGESCEYTDNKYGWKNIRNAEPIRVSNGWLLKMPRALPLD